MPNLSNTDLSNLQISIPSIEKQKNILSSIDSVHAETRRLESLYQSKIEELEALKKSLLEQAFKGEL